MHRPRDFTDGRCDIAAHLQRTEVVAAQLGAQRAKGNTPVLVVQKPLARTRYCTAAYFPA
jgi:hypothetical protein